MDSNGVASHEDHWCKFTKDKINDKTTRQEIQCPLYKMSEKAPFGKCKIKTSTSP